MTSDDEQDMDTKASKVKDMEDLQPAQVPDTELENETGEVERSKSSRRQRQRRTPTRGAGRQLKTHLTVDDVIARFAACDRCSYFLTGYYSAVGLDSLKTTVSQMSTEWVTLVWSSTTRTLVEKSYGVSVDLEYYYYEGCCPNCRRAFVFWAEDDSAQPSFQISV